MIGSGWSLTQGGVLVGEIFWLRLLLRVSGDFGLFGVKRVGSKFLAFFSTGSSGTTTSIYIYIFYLLLLVSKKLWDSCGIPIFMRFCLWDSCGIRVGFLGDSWLEKSSPQRIPQSVGFSGDWLLAWLCSNWS